MHPSDLKKSHLKIRGGIHQRAARNAANDAGEQVESQLAPFIVSLQDFQDLNLKGI